jgi:hypothetical protein
MLRTTVLTRLERIGSSGRSAGPLRGATAPAIDVVPGIVAAIFPTDGLAARVTS